MFARDGCVLVREGKRDRVTRSTAHTSVRPRPIPATLFRTRRSGIGWYEGPLNLTRLRPYSPLPVSQTPSHRGVRRSSSSVRRRPETLFGYYLLPINHFTVFLQPPRPTTAKWSDRSIDERSTRKSRRDEDEIKEIASARSPPPLPTLNTDSTKEREKIFFVSGTDTIAGRTIVRCL